MSTSISSITPRYRRRIARLECAAFLAGSLLLLAVLAASARAAEPLQPPLLRQFCDTGSGAGQCSIPRGVAVDQSSGDVYVADSDNRRIEKLTAWGDVLRIWGWDVVSSGPGDSGTGFEVCVPANEDVCKAGLGGTGAGQFGKVFGPQGVAIDSAGDLYVIDTFNRRVQKFSPDGEFVLTLGGEVNKTKAEEVGSTEAERNLCPVDPGDICGSGAEGTGKGQFGKWELGSYIGIDSKGTTGAADDTIYVGDQGRVQEFDTAGHYLSDLPDPDEVLKKEGTVNSLAVDPLSGALYLGFLNLGIVESKPDLHKLSPAGEEECTIKAHSPSAIAVGPAGEVYLVDGASPVDPREISRFDSTCGGKAPLFSPERLSLEAENQFSVGPGFTNPTAIATSTACGIEGVDLVISNPDSENSFVKLFGPPPQDFDPPCTPPAEVPPSIEASFASSVTSDGAIVKAQIDPHFWPDTTYYVRYATRACIESGGWGSPCVAQQPAAPQLLTDTVSSGALTTKAIFLGAEEALSPDTDYRFRFIAQSSGGGPVQGSEAAFHTYPLPAPAKTDCPNQAFRSAASAPLPDCRAYEMVSPVDKESGEMASPRHVGHAFQQASADGEALTFASTTAFGETEGAALYNQYLSERTAAGWATRSINAPRNGLGLINHEEINTRYKAFSDDLCNGWLLQDTDVPLIGGEVPRGVANLYRNQGLRPGCGAGAGYQLLSTSFPAGYGPASGDGPIESLYYPAIQGFSADGAVSVFRANAVLSAGACEETTEAGPQGKGLYQTYLSREGVPGVPPKLISILPSSTAAACTHTSVGTAQTPTDDSIYHAVSADGTRVYWTATLKAESSGTTPLAGQNPGRIYLRLNATEEQSKLNNSGKCTQPTKACTLPVSAEAEALSESTTSRYLSAASDGSRAIFSTESSTGADLYEFDLAKALAGKPYDTLIAPKVAGILGAGDDAGSVYLVSAASLEGQGEAGKPNLYLYRRGVGARFIATLSDASIQTFLGGVSNAPVSPFPSLHTSRVSPDGAHAAFTSADPALSLSVAGYDNTDGQSGRADQEVYLYDAAANGGQGRLLCASCNPSGARPTGRVIAQPNNDPNNDLWAAARIPGWASATHPGNLLSDDGRRLFFESFEPLVPRDSNGKGDVYEWEQASSKAQCVEEIGGEIYEPATEGCLGLISSGQGGADSELIDASTDGRDVFFLTSSGLLPQDISAADAYDARALGGFPAPQGPPPSCEGEACQSPPTPPDDPTPASSSFRGAGNVKDQAKPRCKKGKVRRKGRCARRRRGAAGAQHRLGA